MYAAREPDAGKLVAGSKSAFFDPECLFWSDRNVSRGSVLDAGWKITHATPTVMHCD
jgi:hypothetical protein